MYRTPSGNFLVLKLKDGVRYIESEGQSGYLTPAKVLTRYRFKETEQRFDISGMNKLHRTDEGEFKSAYQMMNLKQLKDNEHMTLRQIDSGININYKLIVAYMRYFAFPHTIAARR